jgi:hypothetical protein
MTNKEIIVELGNAIGPSAAAMLPFAKRWTLAEFQAAYEKYLVKDRDGVIAALRAKMDNEEAAEATVKMGLLFGQMADENKARAKAAEDIGWAILRAVFGMLLTGGIPFF